MGYEQHDREENVSVDYNTILLNQMNRLGHNTSMVLGEIVTAGGQLIKSQENDRLISFIWGVQMLEMFVPKLLHDKEYEAELKNGLKQIKEEYDKKREQARKEEEKDAELGKLKTIREYNLSLSDKAEVHKMRLRLLVNLLGRRGFLFDTHQAVILPKREEFENG